jgi:hypothetical protein
MIPFVSGRPPFLILRLPNFSHHYLFFFNSRFYDTRDQEGDISVVEDTLLSRYVHVHVHVHLYPHLHLHFNLHRQLVEKGVFNSTSQSVNRSINQSINPISSSACSEHGSTGGGLPPFFSPLSFPDASLPYQNLWTSARRRTHIISSILSLLHPVAIVTEPLRGAPCVCVSTPQENSKEGEGGRGAHEAVRFQWSFLSSPTQICLLSFVWAPPPNHMPFQHAMWCPLLCFWRFGVS